MTTPSLDTVLTVTVSEPALKPARCEVGKTLIHQWATAVRLENDREKCLIIFFSHRPYDDHRRECGTCTEYESYRMIPYKTGEQDETRTGN